MPNSLPTLEGNPITRNNALMGIKAIKEGIEAVATHDALTQEANEKILFGAYLAGKSLCEVAMALHQKAAHVLGGTFGMEHSSIHTVLQAYVLAYQWEHLSKNIQQDFKESLGAENPALALKELAEKGGAPTNLKSIGFEESAIEKAAEIIESKPYSNVTPITEKGLIEMLKNAYNGII